MRKVLLLAFYATFSPPTIQAQDWRTDEVIATVSDIHVKMEVLKHLTPSGQVVCRITNLQPCNTDISIHCGTGYAVKNFDGMETDTANFTIDLTDGNDDLIYAVPWTFCDGNVDTDISSAVFYDNSFEPAIVEQVVIDNSLGINIRLANHRKRNVTRWLTGIPIIVRLGIPNRTQKTN